MKDDTTTLMLHSVGLNMLPWVYSNLSEPLDLFEAKMRFMKTYFGETRFFGEHSTGKRGRELVLSFDDGYLDNWVYAFPILEALKMKATIFVTGEFVDAGKVLRERMVIGDPREKIPTKMNAAGFLSWAEMMEMERSGLIDIQSHGLTHTWYFTGPRIVDYWRPGIATERKGAVWMLWNKFPEFKPNYMLDAPRYERQIPYGTPIYQHAEALVAKKYTPDPRAEVDLCSYVADQGGERFFDAPDWRSKLDKFAGQYEGQNMLGEYEMEEEQFARIERELSMSKQMIEQGLNKTVTAFCWPRGRVTDRVIEMAREVGYTDFPLPSSGNSAGLNLKHVDLVSRIGLGTEIKWKGERVGQQSVREFIWRMKGYKGSFFHRFIHWIWNRFRIICHLLRAPRKTS